MLKEVKQEQHYLITTQFVSDLYFEHPRRLRGGQSGREKRRDKSFQAQAEMPQPRRPRGSQSGREKRRDESFQVRAKEPLGTDSHRAISKNSSGCRLLIGHKKCFVLLCPIGEQFLLSSFREFVHDGYCFDHGLSGSCTKEMHAVRKLSV